MADDQRLEQLKSKYSSVISLAPQAGARLQNVHIEGGKLLIRAEAPSEEAKNKIWDQIKLVDPSYSDLTADITVKPGAAGEAPRAQAASTQSGSQTYTVQAGDTLSKLAKQFYGDAGAYMTIFEANRDKLSDPDKIRVGQQLVIPPK